MPWEMRQVQVLSEGGADWRALGVTYHSCSVAEAGFQPGVIMECTGLGQVISESIVAVGRVAASA